MLNAPRSSPVNPCTGSKGVVMESSPMRVGPDRPPPIHHHHTHMHPLGSNPNLSHKRCSTSLCESGPRIFGSMRNFMNGAHTFSAQLCESPSAVHAPLAMCSSSRRTSAAPMMKRRALSTSAANAGSSAPTSARRRWPGPRPGTCQIWDSNPHMQVQQG